MRKVKLEWYNLGSVRVLYEVLKPDDYFRKLTLDPLKKIGFYMFVDKAEKARYVGQAFNWKQYPLAHRVRWEIVKDGNGCAKSAFFEKSREYGVDRLNLLLKAAHLKVAQQDGLNVEVDKKFMNAVERALIFDRAHAGNPLMNETGKKRYRLGPTEIANVGDFKPLPNSKTYE